MMSGEERSGPIDIYRERGKEQGDLGGGGEAGGSQGIRAR